MSETNRPVGDAMAMIERDRNKTDFAPLGPVWLSERGNLTLTMLSEPLEWRNPQTRRTILIRMREGVQVVQQGGRVESQSYAPSPAPARANRSTEDDIPFDAAVDVDVVP